MMTVFLLIMHGLTAVFLLGALSHQCLACVAPGKKQDFSSRYRAVNPATFVGAVIVIYILSLGLGAYLYPDYRLDVRIALHEMQLGWAIGLFELKEHFGGLGLAILPLYWSCWHAPESASARFNRIGTSTLLCLIVWFEFIVGHVLNNFRGL